MGLANLSGLIFLLSIPALIYIYYFSRRKRRVEISSIIPWRLLKESVIRSSLFRADLLFYVQLLLLLALVAAACRPYWESRSAAEQGRHRIIVIDRSASMQARHGKSRRWDEARARAIRLLRRSSDNDRITIIASGPQPEIIASKAVRKRAGELMEGLEPEDAPDSLGPAINLAVSLTPARGKQRPVGSEAEREAGREAEIWIFTDRAARSLGIEKPVASGELKFVRVGAPVGNCAITSCSVFRHPFRSDRRLSAFATVENFSEGPFKGMLKVKSRMGIAKTEEVALSPGSSITLSLGNDLPRGLLEVTLDPPDALAADNRAYIIAGDALPLRVALFTRDEKCADEFRFIAEAAPLLELDVFNPDEYVPKDMLDYALAVFHRCEPEVLPPTSLLVIFPPVGSRILKVAPEMIKRAAFLDWDERHPVGRDLRGLGGISVEEARIVETPLWGKAVVVTATGDGDKPLVVCGEYGGRKVAVASYDTAAIDLKGPGTTPALVLLLNLVGWLVEPEGDQIKTGEPYETRLASGGGKPSGRGNRFRVTDPRGREVEVRADGDGKIVFRDTARAGFYGLEGSGLRRRFAANLFDRGESDLRRGERGNDRVEAAGAIYLEGVSAAPPDRTELFLAVSLAILLIEWLFYAVRPGGWAKGE